MSRITRAFFIIEWVGICSMIFSFALYNYCLLIAAIVLIIIGMVGVALTDDLPIG